MKKIFLFIVLLLIVGCSKESKTIKISMQCNGIVSEFEVKKNDLLSCKLLGEDYEFKVKKVTNDEIYIEANKFGLGEEYNFEKNEKQFVLKKDNELNLVTQSLDYQENVSFMWK